MDCHRSSQFRGTEPRYDIRTSKVASQHEIQHKETIFVILESISQVDDEWMVDLHRVLKLDSGEVSQSPHKRTSSSNLRS